MNLEGQVVIQGERSASIPAKIWRGDCSPTPLPLVPKALRLTKNEKKNIDFQTVNDFYFDMRIILSKCLLGIVYWSLK